MSNTELPVTLFILRLGLGAFLLLFGIDKLVAPATTVEVFAQYYGLAVSHGMAYGAGVLRRHDTLWSSSSSAVGAP